MIQYQILETNIKRTIWQTVRRIANEILGVKGFTDRSGFIFFPIEQKIVYGGMGTTLVRLRKCSCGPSKPEIRSTV